MKKSSPVRFHGDGLSLTPQETADFLGELTAAQTFVQDSYSCGGIIEELETRMATLLGKERAVFMPTGTLANHLALRALCAPRGRRVVAQAPSHLVNDAGDCAQILSGLNLIPLGKGEPCFSPEELAEILAESRKGKVATPIGAVSIESPIRRLDNVAVPLAELETLSRIARAEGIGLHLDGARLPLYAAHFGIDPATVAHLFDTVYISLYKCFSAPSGAILAGPADLLDGIFHARRMFGGGLQHAWPLAAVALQQMEPYFETARQIVALSEELFIRLQTDGRWHVQRIPQGTNVFHLKLNDGDPGKWRDRVWQNGVELPQPDPKTGVFVCKTNPTWVRATVNELAQALLPE